nr:putative sporulation protein YtxC [Alkaliphilus hydrothermalis]
MLLIETDKSIEVLQEKLKNQLEEFIIKGIQLKEELLEKGSTHQIKYSVRMESVKDYPISDFINAFKKRVAQGLWEYIQSVEELNMIKRIIAEEYYYFNEREQSEIQRSSINILDEESKVEEIIHLENTRKTKTLRKLIDYLNTESEINLKGFVTFRLKDYKKDLEETVEKAIEDFLMDKEYNEFIKLLKYFVDIQESKIELVNVVLGEDQKYTLYDGENNLINNDYLKEIATEISDNTHLSYEDILMSSLITMAPRKIVLHQIANIRKPEIIRTITRVFAAKVSICNDCQWCTVQSNVGVGVESNMHKE